MARSRRLIRIIMVAAREHRRSPTPAERVLWRALRRDALGAPVRRQHPFHRFILDFYCPAARLCIELDGGYHAQTLEQDAARDEWLREAGIRVLRIPNDLVLHDLESALDLIYRCIHPDPSPRPPPPIPRSARHTDPSRSGEGERIEP